MKANAGADRKFLLQLLRPYKGGVLFVLLTSVAGSAFDGISIGMLLPLLGHLQGVADSAQFPLVFRWVLSWLQVSSAKQQVVVMVGVVLGAVLLKNLLLSASIKAGHKITAQVTADLRKRATSLLLDVGVAFHYQSKTGELLDTAVNSTTHIEILVRFVLELLANTATFVALVGLLVVLSWQLTLIVFLFGVVCAGLMGAHTRSMANSGGTLAHEKREWLSLMHECLSGIVLIKASSHEADYARQLEERIEAVRRIEYHHNFKGFLVHPLVDIVGTLGIGALVAAAMVFSGSDARVLLASLLPFMYVVLRLVPLAKILTAQRAEVASRWTYLSTMREFLRRDDKPFIRSGTREFEGLRRELRFKDVSFSYQSGDELVLEGASFVIPAGQTTAIVGESGAGKSTLLQLILRLYEPQSGEITLDGEPISQFTLESLYARIGVVSQDTFLFHQSVRDNITLGSKTCSDAQVIEAAKRAGAHEFIEQLSQGYATVVGDRGVKLSGGQRQRIAIARALLKDPDILIFDEATNALDEANESLIHRTVAEFGEGKTVLVVTHRLSAAIRATQVLSVGGGQGQVRSVAGTERLR